MADILDELSSRHGFSRGAVTEAGESLRRGNGSMAQFSHPEFGGTGQWMPGMIMIGDMFNSGLRGRVDRLFYELNDLLPRLAEQNARAGDTSAGSPSTSRSWYPSDLGVPSAVGGQNNMRYAFFPGSRRLVVEVNGHQTIYDTGDHVIGGVSQQQSGGNASDARFTSQYGDVRLESLRTISG